MFTSITMSVDVAYISPRTTRTSSKIRYYYRKPLFEPLDDRAVHESIAQMERIRQFTDGPFSAAVRPLEISPVVRSFRHLPRGKLDRWRSLKEKRRAWGL